MRGRPKVQEVLWFPVEALSDVGPTSHRLPPRLQLDAFAEAEPPDLVPSPLGFHGQDVVQEPDVVDRRHIRMAAVVLLAHHGHLEAS